MKRRRGKTVEVCKRKKRKQEEVMQDIDYGDDSMSESDYEFRPDSNSESVSWSADSESMTSVVVALHEEIEKKMEMKKQMEMEKPMGEQKMIIVEKEDNSEPSQNSKVVRLKKNPRIAGVKPNRGIKKLDPVVFVDNSKSVGGQVKEAATVVATFYKHQKLLFLTICNI